jgi:hypothetical protein
MPTQLTNQATCPGTSLGGSALGNALTLGQKRGHFLILA